MNKESYHQEMGIIIEKKNTDITLIRSRYEVVPQRNLPVSAYS